MPKKSSKKVSKKSEGSVKTLLKEVSEQTRFHCHNGEVYKSLEELKKGIKKMNSKIFSHHVGKNYNHFANWVYDCVGDIELAEDIRPLTNKTEITKKITSRITALKRKLKSS